MIFNSQRSGHLKLGIIVSFFDFRADVRDLVQTFQLLGHDVVLFARAGEMKHLQAHQLAGVEYREIREERRTWRNRLLEYVFLFFRILPKSRHNYFLMELFKVSNAPSLKARRMGRLVLAIQQLGIEWISYDTLIRSLQYAGDTQLDDIDQFIGFTEFPSDYLAARLLKEARPLKIYVYSWDHPCKHTRFSPAFQYMVWSESIKNDLIELQQLPADRISIVGATQFSYIWSYLQQTAERQANPYTFPYVYYCCAIGIKELVPQEVSIIHTIAAQLAAIHPDWKLVVRPYPVLDAWDLYGSLNAVSNVVMDDGYRTQPFSDPRAANFDKFDKIKAARLLLHTGSTIGLEACLLDTPSFLIDFGYGSNRKGLSVYGFVHQYQNERYLLDMDCGIADMEQLVQRLQASSPIQNPSLAVAANFPVASMEIVALNMLNHTPF